VEHQLNQLQNQIQDVHKKIRIDDSMSNNIEWAHLIQIVQDDVMNKLLMETSDQTCGPTKDLFPSNLNDRHQNDTKPKPTIGGTNASELSFLDEIMIVNTRRRDELARMNPSQSSHMLSKIPVERTGHASPRSKQTKKSPSKGEVADQGASRPQSSSQNSVQCQICNFDNLTVKQASESCLVCGSLLFPPRPLN
jgi:hypothetical protein